MSKPTTLKDLMIAEGLTTGDVQKIARGIFNGDTELAHGPEGYVVIAPKWDDLPTLAKDFIVKALLESHIMNVLDVEKKPKRGSSKKWETDGSESGTAKLDDE